MVVGFELTITWLRALCRIHQRKYDPKVSIVEFEFQMENIVLEYLIHALKLSN